MYGSGGRACTDTGQVDDLEKVLRRGTRGGGSSKLGRLKSMFTGLPKGLIVLLRPRGGS